MSQDYKSKMDTAPTALLIAVVMGSAHNLVAYMLSNMSNIIEGNNDSGSGVSLPTAIAGVVPKPALLMELKAQSMRLCC